jgi:hypothetical protein
MQEHRLLSFEPFRLDVPNAQLWRGQEVIRLTNKALAVLALSGRAQWTARDQRRALCRGVA